MNIIGITENGLSHFNRILHSNGPDIDRIFELNIRLILRVKRSNVEQESSL